VTAYIKEGVIRVVGVAMFVAFRPFVFQMHKSLKRGLRDRDWVCDAKASLLRVRRSSEGLDFVGSVKLQVSRG